MRSTSTDAGTSHTTGAIAESVMPLIALGRSSPRTVRAVRATLEQYGILDADEASVISGWHVNSNGHVRIAPPTAVAIRARSSKSCGAAPVPPASSGARSRIARDTPEKCRPTYPRRYWANTGFVTDPHRRRNDDQHRDRVDRRMGENEVIVDLENRNAIDALARTS